MKQKLLANSRSREVLVGEYLLRPRLFHYSLKEYLRDVATQ